MNNIDVLISLYSSASYLPYEIELTLECQKGSGRVSAGSLHRICTLLFPKLLELGTCVHVLTPFFIYTHACFNEFFLV